MIKCPRCGSTAQVKNWKTDYEEDGWDIAVIRRYTCGCGCRFTGVSVYTTDGDGYELFEEDE